MEARLIGKTVGGRYQIERVLGSGGMGSVYAATDASSGERVAVKLIHGNLPGDAAALIQRFQREARAAGSIDTEHICKCLDAGSDPESGQPFMVLEYLVGEDLQSILKRLGPLPPDLALRVVAQATQGLVAAHQANVVHRDIKPANIFLAKASEGTHTVKLLDFGVAKIRRDPSDMGSDTAGLTRTGSLLGSPLYMSPEQARSVKSVDHRADIWSMGVVLYQSVAGRTPYHHISGLGDLILALCSDLPPPVQQFAPWVDPSVAAVIDRALRIHPHERWATAQEMLDAIVALLPDGTAIRDDMMVPLDDETHDHIAPTFFRNLAAPMAPRPALALPIPQSAHTETEHAVTVPSVPPGTSAPPPAPSPSTPPQTTQNAVATTGPGLGSSPNEAPKRSIPVAAIAIACVLAGGGGVYLLTRPSPAPAMPKPAVTASAMETASAPPIVTAVPTVAPQVTATASAAPTADPAPADSASAKPVTVGGDPPHPPAQPAASASAPKPAASVPKKGVRMDHTSYGDRK